MPHANLIITNAHALTMDRERPSAQAVALKGQQILAVGSHEEAIEHRGPHTRVVDAGGATLLPGLIDSHYHLLLGSLRLDGMLLDAVTNATSLASTIQSYAASHPDAPWLAGYGLRYGMAPGGGELTRHDLDELIPGRPVLLTAFDGHTAWANTRALELGGALHGYECGPNSEVVMGSDGLAAGELREPGAFGPLRALIPKPDEAARRRLLREGLKQAAQHGITSLHNMDGDLRQLELYRLFEQSGDLSLRVSVPYSVTPATTLEQLSEALEMRARADGPLVRAGSVKFFMDGVIEGYTGLVLHPYAGRPDCTGDANFTSEQFEQLACESDRHGLQIIVHAIGDLAVRRTLDGIEAARRTNGPRDSRHRVEHIELLDPGDLPRFATLGVVASMQPLHASVPPGYGAVWLERVGPGRYSRSFQWRALLDSGAPLAFGSDWPVVSQSPLLGLHAAVNRVAWSADAPNQALSLSEALAAYTTGGAYAEHQENQKGMLRPSMLADLTLLDRDITRDLSGIRSANVAMTVCGGRAVFEG